MSICLGNLSLRQMEDRLGITLTDTDRLEFESNRQEAVNGTPLAPGKWHCFDIPFMLLCDTMETAVRFRDILSKYALKGTFQIGWERSAEE